MAGAGVPLLPTDPKADAEWKEPLCPWTSKILLCYCGVTLVAECLALTMVGVNPRWENPSPDEIWHAKIAILLVFSAFITEICFLASSATNATYLGVNLRQSLQVHRVGDSFLTISEYITKVIGAAYMGFGGGGIVHTDALAWSGPRPVYFARFWQWSIAVPILVVITNRSFFTRCSMSEMLTRCAPSIFASFLYCWASWIMEVTPNPTLRYLFMFFSMSGAFLVSMDQLHLAYLHRKDDLFSWKCVMLVYQLVSFVFYSCLFMSGRFGLVSSFAEQVTYAYCDSSIKVFQGAILAMIRNRQDLQVMRTWWVAALAVGKDLDNLIQKARVPVFSMDTSGKVLEWNTNLVKLTGLKPTDVVGKMLVDIASADCKESVEECIAYVVKTADDPEPEEGVAVGDTVASSSCVQNFVELTITVAGEARKIGGPTARQLAMTMVPKSTTDGSFAGIVAIGQDLSDIAELKIIQERKSALMAMLSHEIRSPLHGIMGLTGAMLESELGKTMGRQLGMVKGCTARLLDMVTNIMDLAQHEKRKRDGKPAPRPTTPVNFCAIANEVATMTDMAVDKMNKPLLRPSVRLVNALAGVQVPLMEGDPQKCTQLVYNLVTNACKFTDRGTVTIGARYEKEQKLLEVDVTDTGKGISKEGQKRIFQAFEQEQNGDNRSFQGIGLGLAVCTEIVELHGGTLRVNSELGRGSTFTASFPCDGSLGLGEAFDAKSTPAPTKMIAALKEADEERRQQALPAPARAAPAAAAPAAPATPATPANVRPLVLSVDDDEVNQEVVKVALAGLCDVYCAMDGAQAVKFLEERRSQNLSLPDTVLLDIQMPGMSGFEVCEEMRQRFEANHCKMPIVMISAKVPQDQTALKGFRTGMTDFVPKPFNTEVLRKKMQVVLEAKRDFDIGASTAFVSAEACIRLKDAEQRLEDEQARGLAHERLSQTHARKAEELEGQLKSSETRLQASESEVAELKKRLAELEAKADAEPDAGDREAALAAEKQRSAAADAQRARAEKKAQELGETVRKLQEKLRSQDAGILPEPAAGRPRPGVGPLPIAAIRAATAAAISATAAEGEESEAKSAMEKQHQIIGALLRQALGARAVVRALSSRIEILNALVRGCFDLIRMPMAELAEDRGMDPRARQGHLRSQIDGWKTVAHIVASQLTVMEHVAVPPVDLANIAMGDDPSCVELCDLDGGELDGEPAQDSGDDDILFIGA